MSDTLLTGMARHMIRVPASIWRHQLAGRREHMAGALAFMTPEHQRVRDYVVLQIPRLGRPLSPNEIAAALDLPPDRTTALLDELERRMTFLYRNEAGAVSWAYPVTAEPTPHRLTFSSGEKSYAA